MATHPVETSPHAALEALPDDLTGEIVMGDEPVRRAPFAEVALDPPWLEL